MPAAARVGDQTTHGGLLIPPPLVTTVLIEGRPAAVVGTQHTCPITPNHLSASSIATGSSTVFIAGYAAARAVVDTTACGAAVTGGALRTQIGG